MSVRMVCPPQEAEEETGVGRNPPAEGVARRGVNPVDSIKESRQKIPLEGVWMERREDSVLVWLETALDTNWLSEDLVLKAKGREDGLQGLFPLLLFLEWWLICWVDCIWLDFEFLPPVLLTWHSCWDKLASNSWQCLWRSSRSFCNFLFSSSKISVCLNRSFVWSILLFLHLAAACLFRSRRASLLRSSSGLSY